MSIDQAISLVNTLAWPLVVLAVVFSLRKEIRKLIPSIKKLKTGPFEVEFDRQLSELIAESSEVLPDPSNGVTMEVLSVNDRLVKLARINPRSAILEAWRKLELSLRDAIELNSTSANTRRSSAYGTLTEAERLDILPSSQLLIANELRSLRNQAAHVEDFQPSEDSALRYIELAKKIESHARQSVEHLPSPN